MASLTPEEDDLDRRIKKTNDSLRERRSIHESIMGVSDQVRKGQVEEIKNLQKLIAKGGPREKQYQELLDKQIKLNSEINREYQLRGRVTSSFKKIKTEFLDFFKTQASWFNLGEQIAEQYLTVGRNVGLSVDASKKLGDQFKRAVPDVTLLGGEVSDLTNIYTTFLEQSGRRRFFNQDDLVTIEGMAKGLNLLPSEAASMAESFDLMGMSVEETEKVLKEAFVSSNKMGLNSNKVIKVLQNNMKQMQSYSFRGGVKGMTEMSKLAVKMRLDVSDMLGMADKFYEPEGAIEAAANLQMLGGDIANAFGDPFETMYLARNKPEELAKKLQDMTENMMTFNEETGEYTFPPEARMQLKSAGEQLGINTEKMIEMSRQTSKIKDIKMKVSGDIDPDVAEAVAGMAKFDKNDKKWKIDFGGEKIDLGDSAGLQQAITDGLLDQTKSDSDIFRDIAKNTMTMSASINNIGKASTETIATESGAYEAVQEQLKGTIGKMETEYIATAKTIAEKLDVKKLLGDAGLGEAKSSLAKSIEIAAITPVTMLREALESGINISNMDQLDNVLNRLEDVLDVGVIPSRGSVDSITPSRPASYPSRGGAATSDNTLPGAVLPSDNLMAKSLNNQGGGGTKNVNITINGKLDLSSGGGIASVDVSDMKLQEYVKREITNSLNDTSYSGNKAGSTLNSAT